MAWSQDDKVWKRAMRLIPRDVVVFPLPCIPEGKGAAFTLSTPRVDGEQFGFMWVQMP
jgi:hypothetical protein